MIRVGIIGGAGYAAGELIRLLINHPHIDICFVHSTSNAGHKVSDVHCGLLGECDLIFSDKFDLSAIDVLFMCSGHGASSQFWSEYTMPANLKIIDLAQDYRDESDGYVYGLPEVNIERIKTAEKVANPGCFATAIQLALLPLAASHYLNSEINVTAITGATGAGVKPSATTHFSWRSDNISIYKPFTHQHLAEITRTLSCLNGGECTPQINFIPMRGDFARGIFAFAHMDCNISESVIRNLYNAYYADAAFTHVVDCNLDLKQVVNTNKALIKVEKHGNKVLITSVIDNLLKGAAGQAVQNMNIMMGLDQRTGLCLKPSAF